GALVVKVNVKSLNTTSYNLGIFLPDRKKWNGRLMTTENGGFGGGINYPDMGEYTHYGFASVSTDTGHLSDIGDSSWALNNAESITDWSYRALHGSVALAKQIVPAYYRNHETLTPSIEVSYYTGCATGGRQALRSLQLYPEDFDGVLVGDAAWQTTYLQSWSTWMPLQNYPPEAPYHISQSLFSSLTAKITALCDPQDGTTDSIIQNPPKCRIDFAALLCSSPSANQTACDFDISRFKENGGKIIMYHGYADPLIPAGSSVEYVTHTLSAMKINESQLSSFLRLFLVPGMNHCVSNAPTQPNAPWYIAAASQIAGISGRLTGINNITHSVPGFQDAKHDSVLALVKWVEEGVPPDALIATKFVNDTAPAVESQRTLCPWPKVSMYTRGDQKAAQNWVCD
ncbi:feruloyl esterase B, partial [Xylaria sp. FL1042]